jgi:AcrR family transcriptional regulator
MTEGPRTPVSRRERPAKAALTRTGIVAAAVAVLRAEGLEKVTMRRVAQELDTGPASLYVYVASAAELHAAVLDELLGDVDLSDGAEAGDGATAPGAWRRHLETVLTSYIGVLIAYPALARSALIARPSGANYLGLLERLLALLDSGGVPPEQAAWGVDVLLQFATATAAEHSSRDESDDAEAEWDALTGALHDASEQTYPHLRALAGNLLGGSPEQRLSWSFRMLINGIAGTAVPDLPTDGGAQAADQRGTS